MAYTKPNYTGIDRFLNNVATTETPQSTLLMNGQKMEGNMGLARLGHGIAKLLMSGKNQENAMNYGNEQQNALSSGNLEGAAGNAAEAGDMDTAVKLAEAAENAKQRNAMLGIERAKLSKEQKDKADKILYDTDAVEYATMASRFPQLKQKVAEMKEVGKKSTYTPAGKGKDWLVKQFGFNTDEGTAAVQYESMLNNQILPLLKQTFGAQFTEKDREALQKTMGDSSLSPEQKSAALDAMVAQKEQDMLSKEGVLKYKGINPEEVRSRAGVGSVSGNDYSKYGY